MILLNESLIRHHLTSAAQQSIRIHLFDSLNSTNRYLTGFPLDNATIDVCCAETQTQGRGRFDREWFSPYAENIYCSIRWNLGKNRALLSALSLVTGLAIVATLNALNIGNLFIKWPNDLMWCDKKLCGILIESSKEQSGDIIVIIGIGLNVNSKTYELTTQSQLNRPWCSLLEVTQQEWDRNLIIARLIDQLHKSVLQFISKGFCSFLSAWQRSDYLYQKTVQISQPTRLISGTADGVTKMGELIIKDNEGVIHYIASGEATLK